MTASPHTSWTFIGVPICDGDGTRIATLTVRTEEHASTLGRLLSDVGRVQTGALTPRDYDRRWAGISIGRTRLEDRASHALEAMRQAGPPPGAERYRRSASWESS